MVNIANTSLYHCNDMQPSKLTVVRWWFRIIWNCKAPYWLLMVAMENWLMWRVEI